MFAMVSEVRSRGSNFVDPVVMILTSIVRNYSINWQSQSKTKWFSPLKRYFSFYAPLSPPKPPLSRRYWTKDLACCDYNTVTIMITTKEKVVFDILWKWLRLIYRDNLQVLYYYIYVDYSLWKK